MKNVFPIIAQDKIEGKVKVVVPEDVIDKIKYLCTVISNLEWSGILFYTVEGTIKNPSKMVITLKDILPMDRGSAASTEFTYDKRYVEFLMNNEERLNYKSGLIHSHNNMGVFYSSTDQDELKNNSKSHNFYLSVVVNNKLDIIGRIGILGLAQTEIKSSYKSLDENGEEYIVSPTNLKVKSEKLYYIDCDMIYSIPKLNIEEEFINNTNYILNDSSKKNIESNKMKEALYNPSKYNFYSPFDFESYNGVKYSKGDTLNKEKTELDINKKYSIKEDCEKFLIEILGFNDPEYYEELPLDEVFACIDMEIRENQISVSEIVEDISSDFTVKYKQYFYNTNYDFKTIIINIIFLLEDYVEEYLFLEDIIKLFREMYYGRNSR